MGPRDVDHLRAGAQEHKHARLSAPVASANAAQVHSKHILNVCPENHLSVKTSLPGPERCSAEEYQLMKEGSHVGPSIRARAAAGGSTAL